MAEQKEQDSFLDDYIFYHLNRDRNVVISRSVLKKHGIDKVITECARKGFQVKLHTIDHKEMDTSKKKKTGSKLPATSTYILELI